MLNERARQVAIEAKHLRPQSDHVSLREDAMDAFAAAFDLRLAVISAPAGYGKSTTTAAALDVCGRAATWYKLDILDHDPLAFLAAMTRAVQRLIAGFGTALLRELESGPVLDVPVEVLAARFCSECDRWLQDDLHLVLDDYHEAMDSAPFNSVLGYLLDNCPATVHFVILTRYEPAFPVEKLRLAGQVARLPRDLFLFDVRQVEEVLAQRSGRRHDPAHVQRLLELTEGWPASVVLAGMALAWLDVDSLQEALSDPRLRSDMFSYLAEQVFQRQAEEVQRFLLGTCCLEHVTTQLAETLTGSSRASRHLHFLSRNHVFTFQTETAGAYRYHNLLRAFLRQRFVQEEGDAAFRDLQRRTAVALEESGDRPSAIELLLGANELDLALGVIARGGEAELERRPSEQLRLWVERLAQSVEADRPWALVVSAVLSARESRFEAALHDLDAAESQLLADGSDQELYDVLSIKEWTEFWSGDTTASAATSNRALAYAASDGQRLHTLLSLMSSALDMKQWDMVHHAFQRSEVLLPRAAPEEAARAQALRAHAMYFQGDMRHALVLIQECPDHGERAAQRAAALNIFGMIETALARYSPAEGHLLEAREIAERYGHALTTYMIEDSQACLAGARGSVNTSLSILESLCSGMKYKNEPSLQAYAACHWGTVLRRSGDIEISLTPTEDALSLAPLDRDPYLALNASTNLEFTQGLLGVDRRSALLLLAEQARTFGLKFVELKAQLFAGIISYEQGERASARDLLEQCLPEQLRLGHVNFIAQELCPRPELVSIVLRRARTNGIGMALVEAIGNHWRFMEMWPTLVELGPSQIKTWLEQVAAHRGAEGSTKAPIISDPSKPHEIPSLAGDLTKREREVLELMAKDLSNEQIATALYISIPTVKTHVNHIFRKLEQKSRVGAVLAYQHLRDEEGH